MKLSQYFKKLDLFFILLIVYAVWLVSLKNRSDGGMDDFDIFFKAGERLLNRENIYGEPHYYNLKYFYSILFASIMSLFQNLDINIAKLIWFVLNSALLFRVFFLLRHHVLSVSNKDGIPFFFLLLLTGKIVLINYMYNQISVVILWMMLESFHLILKGYIWPALIILCLGINIKILPIVLVPYFIWISKKPVKMILIGLALLVLLTLIPAVMIGWDYNLSLLSEWWHILNPVSKTHVIQTYEYGLTDIASLVTKYFSAEAVYNEPQLHILDLSVGTLFLITNILRIALLSLVIYFSVNLKKSVYKIDHRFIVSAAFMALIPLCFPHQREYSFMFVMPLLAVFITCLIKLNKPLHYLLFTVCVLWAGMLTWVDFAGQDLVNVFMHYRLITMGMTALLVYFVFFILQISKSENNKELVF